MWANAPQSTARFLCQSSQDSLQTMNFTPLMLHLEEAYVPIWEATFSPRGLGRAWEWRT